MSTYEYDDTNWLSDRRANDTVSKNGTWAPYEGPKGGEGWQNIETGEIRYTEDPPGEVADEENDPSTTLRDTPTDALEAGDRIMLRMHGEKTPVTVTSAYYSGDNLTFELTTDSGEQFTLKEWMLNSTATTYLGELDTEETYEEFEQDGFSLENAPFDALEIGDDILVQLDGETYPVEIVDRKGRKNLFRLFIDSVDGDTALPRHILTPRALSEGHFEYYGRITDRAAPDLTEYIDGYPAIPLPDVDSISVGDYLLMEDGDGVTSVRVADRDESTLQIISEYGEKQYIDAENYPEVGVFAPTGAEIIAGRGQGDRQPSISIGDYEVSPIDTAHLKETVNVGQTVLVETSEGEMKRTWVMDVSDDKYHQGLTLLSESGRTKKYTESLHTGDLSNIVGVVENEPLPEPGAEAIRTYLESELGETMRVTKALDEGEQLGKLYRIGASMETLTDVAEQRIESEVKRREEHHSGIETNTERMRRDAAEGMWKELGGLKSNTYGRNFTLGENNGRLTREVFRRFVEDRSGEGMGMRVQNVAEGWSSYTTMMSEETAPLWQTAWNTYANDYVAKNKERIETADVDPEDEAAVAQFREHIIDFYVDALGKDIPDPKDISPDEVAKGDEVILSNGVRGRIVQEHGSRYFDVRDSDGKVHKGYTGDHVKTVTDTRGRVTIPAFKGVHSESDRLRDIQHDIKNGKPVEIRQMTLDSWSTDPSVAISFARNKSNHPGVVYRQEVPVTEIWASSQTTSGLLEFEEELLVGHDSEWLHLDSDEVFVADSDAIGGAHPFEHVAWAHSVLDGRDVLAKTDAEASEEASRYDFTDQPNWLRVVHMVAEHAEREEKKTSNVRRKSYVPVDSLPKNDPAIGISTLSKASQNVEALDDHLMEAIEKQVWPDIEEIEKAPNMWRRSDNVPQYVRTYVKQVLESGVMYENYRSIPGVPAYKVHEVIAEQLMEADGWSTATVSKSLIDEFPALTAAAAVTIARTDVAAVLNTARALAFEKSDVDQQVYWKGPSDDHTTDICRETKSEIRQRGGHVTLIELREILYRKARKYQTDGGTPDRVSEFVPHYNCRHTFVRKSYKFVTQYGL